MNTLERLTIFCQQRLEEVGWAVDKRYVKRLNWELAEISAKNKADYFWQMYETKIRYPINQNNLLVCKLLGICHDYDISQEPACEYGEYPDIDSDFTSIIRDYLKNEWAPKQFGEEYVCNISTYGTYKIKAALLDMARVHDKSHDEIQIITKGIEDKDDDGKPITWDAAMKLYPELKKYCEENPEVAEAARRIMNRNKSLGIHAGGLIVANKPLSDLVPLVKRKSDPQAAAWPEGLSGQDLGPIGLVKFDLLVIDGLLQISHACRLAKQRHGLAGICAKPGQADWTDLESWRNDVATLATADKGDLTGIFQFDSPGIQKLVKDGGVTRFEDLVVYASIFRPGALSMKMDKVYVARKRGKEQFEIHPLLKPILEKTYGVICYQEQIMKILHVVGDIPLKDCEIIRKAISKKKIEYFIKYKEMFVSNGMKNLGYTQAQVEELWSLLEAYSEYGFNLSHACAYTYISMKMLYLKTHFPHEFYAATLAYEHISEKLKQYKMETQNHGIEVHRVDINKSKETFTLVGDVIYFGIGKIKGIGEEAAARLVAGQPYQNFEDFLIRFGTDMSVLKPLISLRCFTDADPVTLWKFVDYFKKQYKRYDNSSKINARSLLRYQTEFETLSLTKLQIAELPEDYSFDTEEWKKYDVDEDRLGWREKECSADDEGAEPRYVTKKIKVSSDCIIEQEELKYYRRIRGVKKFNRWKMLKALWNRYKKTKGKTFVLNLPKLSEFDANAYQVPDEIIKELRDVELCERKFYGFEWVHDLEKSPDYKGGFTFSLFKLDSSLKVNPVEIKVVKVTKKPSSKNKNFIFHQIECEDATGEVAKMNIWPDDWERWEPEFKEGNLLRVRMMPPTGGFPTYTFECPPKQYRWKVPKRKEDDYRVVVLRPPVKQVDQILTHEEIMDQFDV
jgi:DNA polymerase III alpha subunit